MSSVMHYGSFVSYSYYEKGWPAFKRDEIVYLKFNFNDFNLVLRAGATGEASDR